MSLPSQAYFLKNGNIIADTFINVGWVVTAEGVIRCCYDAHNYCLEQERYELDTANVKRTANILEGWKNYDHILLYSYIIPRTTLDEHFLGHITREEFIQRFIDGSYYIHFNKWFKKEPKLFENFDKKVNEKYNKQETK
jgi:hypothetical protein